MAKDSRGGCYWPIGGGLICNFPEVGPEGVCARHERDLKGPQTRDPNWLEKAVKEAIHNVAQKAPWLMPAETAQRLQEVIAEEAEKPYTVWERANGKKILVREMHFEHLKNALAKLERKIEQHNNVRESYLSDPEVWQELGEDLQRWHSALSAEIATRPEIKIARQTLENLALELGLAGSVHAVRDRAVGASGWPGTPEQIQRWIVQCVRNATANADIDNGSDGPSWENEAILEEAQNSVSVAPIALVAKRLLFLGKPAEQHLPADAALADLIHAIDHLTEAARSYGETQGRAAAEIGLPSTETPTEEQLSEGMRKMWAREEKEAETASVLAANLQRTKEEAESKLRHCCSDTPGSLYHASWCPYGDGT
jgi:hypothetical protein